MALTQKGLYTGPGSAWDFIDKPAVSITRVDSAAPTDTPFVQDDGGVFL
jgi:hypothetical protein